ncbi:MAG TPA: hypothetical protein VF149_03955, partial [Bacillales bacterium]
MSAVIRKAEGKDIERIKAFAVSAGVSTEGVRGALDCFYMMENDEGGLMAVVAIEPLEEDGLLRALVIDPQRCGMADVIRFFTAIVSEAEKRGFHALLLITPSPEIFESLEFGRVPGDEIPE